ncbi:hypothetical protein KCU81_g1234, partial [Aureobasidium melanogenum]|uniref:Putative gamma-glutamylcyclotransferase n=1 Tax=Aureobasidium melanogenum (strain CBS 110374) TaxID=1043003 RepID=A0A074W179_AURM1
MDFLMEELERMEANAIDSFEEEISDIDIKRWQALFSMTYDDAHHNLKTYRANIERQRFSEELWLELKASKEAQGFDRESCEYALFCRSKVYSAGAPITNSAHPPSPNSVLRGLILGGPLSTPEDVQDIAGFTPTVVTAESEESERSFCYVTASQEHRIRQGLSDRGTSFEPCFVSINIAAKDLSTLPTLGVDDTTMPQHRLNHAGDLVKQQQFPVLYFFYGTLAQPEILKRVLELENDPGPALERAHVLGGKITALGQYRALVNSSNSRVNGHAFMVQSEDQELALRLYETNIYEVVRCDIILHGEGVPVKGLTFRLAASR